MEALLAVGAAAAAVAAILALATWGWRKLGRPLARFLAEWSGWPDGPERSVPARLTAVEEGQQALRGDVAELGQQLRVYLEPGANGAPVPTRAAQPEAEHVE